MRTTPLPSAFAMLFVLSACYASHEVGDELADGGASDVIPERDVSDAFVSADVECLPPERCNVWVAVSWQADLPTGAIDRVMFVSNMSCSAGSLSEDGSIIGSTVSPREPRRLSRTNLCSGCFFVSARALDADGRELARGREDFCVEDTRSVLLTLR